MLSLARASLPRKATDAKHRGSGKTSTANGTSPGA
nr:MAG TPA: Shikimate kinase [Caudoviricetes sp.]